MSNISELKLNYYIICSYLKFNFLKTYTNHSLKPNDVNSVSRINHNNKLQFEC